MKRLSIYKVAALAAALAISGVASDAFGRGGGGGREGAGAHGSTGTHASVADGSRGLAVGGSRLSSWTRIHHSRWGWVSYPTYLKRWSGW
jgi:hypothetical protein